MTTPLRAVVVGVAFCMFAEAAHASYVSSCALTAVVKAATPRGEGTWTLNVDVKSAAPQGRADGGCHGEGPLGPITVSSESVLRAGAQIKVHRFKKDSTGGSPSVSYSLISVLSDPKRDVLELYLSIPVKKLQWMEFKGRDFDATEVRRSEIKLKDVRNGYLEIGPDDGSVGTGLALFKTKRGPMLAIAREGVSVQNVWFLLPDEGWRDVTKEVLPSWSRAEAAAMYRKRNVGQPTIDADYATAYAGSVYRIRLPRKGTTIRVVASIELEDAYDRELTTLSFDGEKFIPAP